MFLLTKTTIKLLFQTGTLSLVMSNTHVKGGFKDYQVSKRKFKQHVNFVWSQLTMASKKLCAKVFMQELVLKCRPLVKGA